MVGFALKTERLSLRPLTAEDVFAFVRYRRNPKVAKYQSWDVGYSEDDGIRLIEAQAGIDLPAEGEWLQLAIHELKTNLLVGDVALHSLDAKKASFELGFTLAPEFQGKGFGREAVGRVIEYLVDEVGATRLEASTDRRNIQASKLLIALGFEIQPERSWEEDFKGEKVTVDVYQASYPRLK
jgi:RimJ/RimL family protein N-acetyltransferase